MSTDHPNGGCFWRYPEIIELLMRARSGGYRVAEVPITFVERVQAYLRKALREAKVRTSWTDPSEPYESAVADFAAKVARDEAFLADFRPLHRRVSHLGTGSAPSW
mgnify:CR=1 FL=1